MEKCQASPRRYTLDQRDYLAISFDYELSLSFEDGTYLYLVRFLQPSSDEEQLFKFKGCRWSNYPYESIDLCHWRDKVEK